MSGPSPVVIEFVTRNLDQVLKAMRSIADVVTQTERKSAASAKANATEAEKAAQKQVQSAAKAAAQTQRLLQASEKAGAATVAAGLRTRLANQARHLRTEFETVQKFEKNKQAIRERSASMAGKFAAKQVADEMRAAREVEGYRLKHVNKMASEAVKAARQVAVEEKRARLSILKGDDTAHAALGPQARLRVLAGAHGKAPAEQRAAVEKVRNMADDDKALLVRRKKNLASLKEEGVDHLHIQKEMTKQTDAEEKRRLAIRERSATMAGKFAAKQAREEAQARKQADEEFRRKNEQFGRTAGNTTGNVVKGATTIAGTTLRTLGNLGGGFSIEGALQERVALDRQAALVGVKSGQSSQGLINAARATSVKTGTDADEVLRGVEAFGDKSGDWAGAQENSEFFAKYAKVTGSSTKDVAGVAGMLAVQNKDLQGKENAGQLRQLTLDIMAMSRAGAVDVPELLAQVSSITKSSAGYAGDQTDTQRRLIASSQIGVRTGSVAEAATALSNLPADLQSHAGEAEAFLGKEIFNEKHQIAMTPEQLVAHIIDKAGGDPTKIMKMGSDKTVIGRRSDKLFKAVLPTYNKAEKKALEDGKSKEEAKSIAKQAVLDDFGKFTDAKTTTEGFEKDFTTVMKSSAEQFEAAVRELKMEVGQQLLPVLREMVPTLQQLVPAFKETLQLVSKFGSYFAKNPIEGFGLLLAGLLTQEIASAGLRVGLEKALATSMGQGAGLSVASAAVAITAATLMVAKWSQDEDERQTRGVKATVEAANAIGDLRVARGSGSVDEMGKSLTENKEKAAQLEASINESKAKKGGSKWYLGASIVGAAVADTVTLGGAQAGKKVAESHRETKRIDQERIDEQIAQYERLKAAIEATEKAMKALAANTPAGPPTPPGAANPSDPSRGLPISRR